MTVEQITLGIMAAAIGYIGWSLRSMIETMKKNDREHYEHAAQERIDRMKGDYELEIRLLRERK